MRDLSPKSVTGLNRLRRDLDYMAFSFREFAATGGKFIGSAECTEVASYFESKCAFVTKVLAELAGEQPKPGPTRGKPRLATVDGETV